MNKIVKHLYNSSPIWLQNSIISIYGMMLYGRRYGKEYKRAFKLYTEKDYSDITDEKKIQLFELKRLISHASSNSPYYKNLYSNIDLSRIQSVDDLNLIPIVEKEDFRKNIQNIYTIEESKSIKAFTGGTTGKSLQVRYTKADVQTRMAYLDAFKWKLGISPFKVRKATFSGREFTNNKKSKKKKIFWRYNWVYKQKMYSTFDLNQDNLPYYIEDLNRFKPEVINGFVSAIYELAKYIEMNEVPIQFIPKAIFTTSENLLPYHRKVIEKVFKTNIYNQYASAEGAPFITECKLGNLHYNIDTGVIEELDTEHGSEMLVTSFTTYGTPLIRYKIGDKVEFMEGQCSCGSCHPLVKRIDGRQVEYLISKKRGKISLSHLADVIKGMPNSVINMQFVQNELQTIKINLIVDKEIFNKNHEKSIIQEMKFRFGAETQITLNYVDHIPRESSGKLSLIKNSITSNQDN